MRIKQQQEVRVMSKHLKRIAAPRSLLIKRKISRWAIKSSPGPHPVDKSIPLGTVVRDYLSMCDTKSEAKKIISDGEVQVDGSIRRNIKFPCGLMDVVSIPKIKKFYRVIFNQKGKLVLVPIEKEEGKWKPCRIENKTIVRRGKVQLNLHDGRNLLVDEDNYGTGDVIKLSFDDNKIIDVYKFDKNTVAMVTGGSHIGEIATIEEIRVTRSSRPNVVVLKGKNSSFPTIKDYVFPIGKESPEIKLPEVSLNE